MKIWINADDFGFTKSASNAIYECFKNNMITTTTMCSNGEYFDYAISLIKETPYESKIGLHINLTEGKPLTEDIKKCKKICDENGCFKDFPKRYSHLSKKEKEIIYLEMEAQYNRLVDAGIIVNHIDSHHHIHNSFRILPLVIRLAKEKGIHRIRLCRNAGSISFLKKIYKKMMNKKIIKSHCAYTDYMGGIDDLINLEKVDSACLTEIMVHPDFNCSGELIDRNNDDYANPTGLAFDDLKNDYEIL